MIIADVDTISMPGSKSKDTIRCMLENGKSLIERNGVRYHMIGYKTTFPLHQDTVFERAFVSIFSMDDDSLAYCPTLVVKPGHWYKFEEDTASTYFPNGAIILAPKNGIWPLELRRSTPYYQRY